MSNTYTEAPERPRRTMGDRVSEAMWGPPEASPQDRAQLAAVRASVRDQARSAEYMYLAELDRADAGRGVMEPPPRSQRQQFGTHKGEYQRGGSGNYDWFDGLSKAEQARLRDQGWFAEPGHGQSPDEIAQRIPISEWLQLTRAVDMTRAMASGRGTNPRRYGGQDPRSLIVGEPYDFAELHHANEGRAALHLRRARESGRLGMEPTAGSRCQFRTRPDGTVYPLSSTCSRPRPSYANVYGQPTGTVDYGDDEEF